MRIVQRILIDYFHALYRHMVDRLVRAQTEIMRPHESGLHLDLGSHNGDNAARLAASAGFRTTFGIDYDVDLLREGLRQEVQGIQADLNNGFPLCTACFDAVTAMDVIEHLIHTTTFVGEVFRVLKPGGYVVIATPNLAAWHNVYALVLGLQPFSGPSVTDMTDGEIDVVRRLHRRAYDLPEEGDVDRPEGAETVHRHLVVMAYRSLINTLTREGFVIESACGYGYYPLPPFLAAVAARVDIRHSVHLLIRARKPLERDNER